MFSDFWECMNHQEIVETHIFILLQFYFIHPHVETEDVQLLCGENRTSTVLLPLSVIDVISTTLWPSVKILNAHRVFLLETKQTPFIVFLAAAAGSCERRESVL